MENIEKMKPYFPASLNGCESVSDEFFKCLNRNLIPFGDDKLIKNLQQDCQYFKKNYEKCTDEKLKKLKSPLMFLTEYKEKNK
ncbi:conserved Plasmodium protein, unknown function [Plasmodium sp. DRC-Itaito]|nr:conserved Plasmodium protein, unknown function [Plasmodium sp. DRC-Itaito]